VCSLRVYGILFVIIHKTFDAARLDASRQLPDSHNSTNVTEGLGRQIPSQLSPLTPDATQGLSLKSLGMTGDEDCDCGLCKSLPYPFG
jgi:hypothetical protein